MTLGLANERTPSAYHGTYRSIKWNPLLSNNHGLYVAGHSGEIFAARFDPTGQVIASGSMDSTISTVLNSQFSGPEFDAARSFFTYAFRF